MSRRGNCFDNAAKESFFSTLKRERIRACKYKTNDEARANIFNYIEMHYNPERRHSYLDYVSPDQVLQWQWCEESWLVELTTLLVASTSDESVSKIT